MLMFLVACGYTVIHLLVVSVQPLFVVVVKTTLYGPALEYDTVNGDPLPVPGP